MTAANNSSSWYRVADIKPRLQAHITVHRHEYRHHAWFVLQDRHKGRSHRFNAVAWFLISCMNGERNMQELYDIVLTKFPATAPSQDEVIALFGKLYQAELIHTDSVPDIDELSQREQQGRRQKIKQYFLNPMSLRFPLLNPHRLLDRALPGVRPLFNRKIFYTWLTLTGLALLLALLNWPELSNATRLHAFTTQNILLLLFLYPLIKLVHEFGHALAIRHYGGEVNEMGIILMVFVPLPYVNAHSATAFADKHQRMLVSAMGIMVETTLASLALFLWLLVEPGLLRSICLDIILIGGVATLLINGNPLLKYDGYHVFADLIETPNLAGRAKKYLSWKLHAWLFNFDKGDSGLISDSERGWLFGYALAAFGYRIFLLLFILGMLLDHFFAVGILLAAWVVSLQLILPSLRYVRYLLSSEQVAQHRRRVNSVVGIMALLLILGLFVIPMPQSSSTQGIIWLAEEMQIKARAPGFVRKLLVSNNDLVSPGEPLLISEDPLLAGRVKVLQARLRELQIKRNAKRGEHLEEEQLKQQMTDLEAELALQQERLGSLTLKSPAAGRLVIPNAQDLTDQFVQAGQLIGFVLDPAHLVAQVIIAEDEIALFQQATSVFEIRPVGQADRVIAARFKRLVPEAIKQLPSAALGIMGGGTVLVDPDDPSGRRTMEKVFQLELTLPANELAAYIGSRVYVRIRHNRRPLAWQWGRSIQQLLLGRFHV